MEVREEVIFNLRKIVKDLTGQEVTPQLEHPKEEAHGDYSSNVALVLGKETKQSPLVIAKKIAEKFSSPIIEKVDIAGPGFVNFWLSKVYLSNQLERVLEEKERYGWGKEFQGQKIMLEFADPNPFKEFHIGHLRNISLGESFARLLENQGATVWRVNYQGDVGLHVAKAIWGMERKMKKEKVKIKNLEEKPFAERVKFLGEAYAIGAKAYEEDEKAKKEIQSINLKIYKNDPEIRELWGKGREWSLEHFEEIYKRVGTTYKRYYFESEVAGPGRELVLVHIDDGVFERHERAVVFRGEKHGHHTRVFVTKEDYATYEAKDLALASIKSKDFPYDKSIIITAHEQTPYFKVVLAAMKRVAPDLANKTVHIPFGFVSLKDVKMSSRLANIITGEWLLDEAKRRIKEKFSSRGGPAFDWKEIDEDVAEKVAVGAVKYSMLKFSTASDMSFSFDESISLEGDSGPYLQYTFARTQSVLRKSEARISKSEINSNDQIVKSMEDGRWKMEDEELALLRTIHRFPEVVEEASQRFAPNLLCHYLFNLASAFNLFYQKHPIIDPTPGSGHEGIRELRLGLTEAVGLVLKNGLRLLGIEAVVRM